MATQNSLNNVITNGTNLLTMQGNVDVAGAYALLMTLTAATSVTLPTSGTLVNDAVATLSSLSSIGTITTGSWNGSVVAGQYGGTGIANTGKTITLGGNLVTSGANDVTFTSTGPTNLTLPTSGTLATTAQITGVLPTTVVTGTTQQAAVNSCYVANNAGAVIVTLPSVAAVGDEVQVMNWQAGFVVAQNANQLVKIGGSITTTGVGGSLTSGTSTYDSLIMKCVVANNEWIAYGVQGNLTVV